MARQSDVEAMMASPDFERRRAAMPPQYRNPPELAACVLLLAESEAEPNPEAAGMRAALNMERLFHAETKLEFWRERYSHASTQIDRWEREVKERRAIHQGKAMP